MAGKVETAERRRFTKPNMRDVSRLAQVSLTSVSLYLSGRQGVCSAETARRIDDAVRDLNYTQNSLIHGLRLGRTNCIGVCVAHKTDFLAGIKTPYVSRYWEGLEKVANENRCSLMQYPFPVRQGVDAKPFLDGRIDGLVMAPRHDDPRPAVLGAAGMPAVFTDSVDNLTGNCGVVVTNEEDTANLALTHLRDAGHRRIAHIAAHPGGEEAFTWGIIGRRLTAYMNWMSARDAYDPACVAFAADWDGTAAASALDRLLALPEPPTAIFCANDMIAWKVVDLLEARNIRVPDDISIVGIDNACYRRDRTLTSVDVPVELIGETAMRVLLRLLEGAPLEECRMVIPVTNLVVGSTVKSVA